MNHKINQLLQKIHTRYANVDEGEVASYIPELSKADPDHFGICMVSVDGRVFQVGNVETLFTIQSISKPFTYGMALEAFGQERVSRHVSVEPSGDSFNSIVLERQTNRPFNPMVNAGAITTSALLYEKYGDEAFDIILSRFSIAAGRQLTLDQSVYASESKTGHRNRAIAHLLLNFGMVHENIEPALDLYFKQCSILINTIDLATMGATLAHVGRNPLTNEEAFDLDSVKCMLSVMFTCGMYDYSGQWAYNVGVPAKSGVAGGILAVVNRQLGIASYSPRLDTVGNSYRGIQACKDIASELGLHVFDFMNTGSNYLKVLME